MGQGLLEPAEQVVTNVIESDWKNKVNKREYKQVRLPIDTYNKLISLGNAGNSIWEVIDQLIKEHEENSPDEDKKTKNVVK